MVEHASHVWSDARAMRQRASDIVSARGRGPDREPWNAALEQDIGDCVLAPPVTKDTYLISDESS